MTPGCRFCVIWMSSFGKYGTQTLDSLMFGPFSPNRRLENRAAIQNFAAAALFPSKQRALQEEAWAGKCGYSLTFRRSRGIGDGFGFLPPVPSIYFHIIRVIIGDKHNCKHIVGIKNGPKGKKSFFAGKSAVLLLFEGVYA